MNLGLFALHVLVGGLMIGHGLQKLVGAFGGDGLVGTAGFMESLGLRPGMFHARGAALAETAGGTLLLLGFLTPLAAALIISVMLTATLTAHAGKGLWVTDGGFEYPLVIGSVAFALAAIGPGKGSLDYAFGLDASNAAWALAALAVGVVAGIAMIVGGRWEPSATRAARERRYAAARRRQRRYGQTIGQH
jgi:putative oxidoreductase